MKILVKNKDTQKWKIAESYPLSAEKELQKFLSESPSLIRIDEHREGVSPFVFSIREFSLSSAGFVDILTFTAEGDVAIIECKLASNPQVKREVIGQIFEYAAALWKMDYDELNARIKNQKGMNLADLVGSKVEEGWDEEQFRNGVSDSLAKGSFILIIVVDQINEQLRRIIRYLNECSESAFSLHALEMQRFEADNIDILVPNLYGMSQKPTASTNRKKWSEKEFFEKLEENVPNSVLYVRQIYNLTLQKADNYKFGTGNLRGSFTFYYIEDSKEYSVFCIYTDGTIVLNYGALSKKVSQSTMDSFHRQLCKITGFKDIPNDFTKYPTKKIETVFNKKNNFEKFKDALYWLNDAIKSK